MGSNGSNGLKELVQQKKPFCKSSKWHYSKKQKGNRKKKGNNHQHNQLK